MLFILNCDSSYEFCSLIRAFTPFSADIALIGLAVMGQNLILNMNDHGWVVCAFNRTTEKVDNFLANEAKGTKVVGAHSLQEMVNRLKKPRRIMILVKGKHMFYQILTQIKDFIVRNMCGELSC